MPNGEFGQVAENYRFTPLLSGIVPLQTRQNTRKKGATRKKHPVNITVSGFPLPVAGFALPAAPTQAPRPPVHFRIVSHSPSGLPASLAGSEQERETERVFRAKSRARQRELPQWKPPQWLRPASELV